MQARRSLLTGWTRCLVYQGCSENAMLWKSKQSAHLSAA